MSLFRAEHIALSYRRGGEAVPLLRGASFALEAGAICDLVGPSGAGKSTLLRACALMMARDSGELYLDGRPSSGFKPAAWRRQVCLVPQQASLVAGLVSWKLELGQTRRIAVSSVRCFVQLLAAGFLLTYLFEFQTWWLVLLVLAAMVIAATQIATSRVKSRIPGLVPAVFVSLFVSSTAIGLIVVEGVVHAEPWYNARQLVPIVGMIMGNAMAAVAVAIDRLFADMDARAPEMFSLVALGATPHEAAAPSLKAAIGAGMTPVLANMSAAGIVTFPGMMTGQLLAGADPLAAAKYQIVVMLMLSAANTIAIVMASYLTYRKRFAPDGYYLDKGLRG